jgi:8-oxo-dGTP diphosphatase
VGLAIRRTSCQDPTVPTGQIVSYVAARHLARRNTWREKVLVYVTRGEDLLVLEHTDDHPHAGIQVPAGGVDPGESPARATTRELFEETGLIARRPPTYLQSCWWPDPDAPSRIRHYYWVDVPADTPTTWSHVVTAGEDDHGMTFQLSFRPLTRTDLTPGYGWADALPRLSAVLGRHRPATGGGSPRARSATIGPPRSAAEPTR